jgi:hypothetical protein
LAGTDGYSWVNDGVIMEFLIRGVSFFGVKFLGKTGGGVLITVTPWIHG